MKLLVVGQVDVIGQETLSTRNRSVNLILDAYAHHFDEVVYFGPWKGGPNGGETVNATIEYTKSYASNRMGKVRYLASPAVYRDLDKVMERHNPDLIQVRVPGFFPLKAGHYLKRRHKDKMFCYVAGSPSEAIPQNSRFPGASLVAEGIARWQDALVADLPIVTAGDVLKEEVERRSNNRDSAHAYYSTTHSQVYHSKGPRNLILVMGSLTPVKRPDAAIQTMKLLKGGGLEQFHMTLVGDGPLRKHLEKLIVDLDLQDFVTLHGYERSTDVLRDMLLRTKYLLHLSGHEGTAKVIAEAMAHGAVPVAVKGVGSNDYILRDGVGALVGLDPEGAAEKILEIERDRETFNALQKRGYKYASEHTIEKEVAALFDYVHGQISQPR